MLVVGAGPSGLLLAAELGDLGLSVSCLAPEGVVPWPNSYGVWTDEVASLDTEDLFTQRWSAPLVYVGPEGGQEVALKRTYGRLDNAKLQALTLARCERGTMRLLRGHAAGVTHTSSYSEVRCKDGSCHRARLIVDASGHFPALVERPKVQHIAFQAAYGITGYFSSPPIPVGQMVLMDFRDAHLSDAERREPTFLYAMDLGGGLYFVEETSLVRRPGMSLDVLRERLHRRLAHRGVTVRETTEVEHCLFPMGLPLPDLSQRVVGFGGAASMVHPASGYMMASVLNAAPKLAETVAQALGRGDVAGVPNLAWNTLWSVPKVRQRALYLFGLEALLKLDGAQLQRFFAAFFELPAPLWQGYLSGTLSVKEQAETMARLFARAPGAVRFPLTRTAFGHGGLLAKALA